MAQINKPNTHFNPVLYTGNESTNAITTGLANDFVWVKAKDSGGVNHYLFDSVRGVQKNMHSNTADAEVTEANTLTAFNSTGFTLGSDAQVNGSGQPHISWNWKAGGTAVSNTDGSITSSVSASTTSGFSIVSYTGTGSNATIGHGLGVAPSMIINKPRDIVSSWAVYHAGIASDAETDVIYLEGTGAAFDNSTFWNDTAPNSSVFSVGSATGTGANIAYCFAEKKGFSKFGSYVGNGSSDGTFVYTGFKPAFVMMKNASASATPWFIFDAKRNPSNETDLKLNPNSSDAESSANPIDILSNGFKLRTSGSYNNGSGNTLIYMCFAESPIVGTNGVPTTAR